MLVNKRKHTDTYCLSFHGNKQVKTIVDWLYHRGQNNRLERKINKYKVLLEGL
jgi:hypothetical protein